MGKSESFEFSEMGKYSSETALTNGQNNKGGCFVSTATGFILTFLAAVLAVGVGIIVHFAGSGQQLECTCTYPNGASGTGAIGQQTTVKPINEQCKDLASSGNSEICNACPAYSSSMPPQSVSMSTSMATTTAPPAQLDVRIPLDMYPDLYTVELQPNMYEGDPEQFTFNGSVKIRMLCKHNTRNITLHKNKLNITGDIVVREETGGSSKVISYVSVKNDFERQFLIVNFNNELVAGRYYTIEMSFIGPLKNDLAGLYLSSYQRGNQTIYIATTQFQATDARKTFPCFDEPAIKAKFDITLVRKSHMVSLSNMPNISAEDRGNGWVADHFNITPAMSTYLLAFIISDFEYTENMTKNNVLYRAWSRPEAIQQTHYALQVGVDILTYFEEYFNVTFPLPKQDMIAIPDFAAGAMENWGLITYRETAMLYDPVESSEGNKQRVAVVVSHELAHQWFGNLVTPSWWDDLWLNEGFASFVEYMGVDIVHPDWLMFEQFVVTDVQDVFNFDGLVTSHPVYVPVQHPDQIAEIFDRISYGKGASIIRMMRFFLGEETFRKGLSRYLKALQYGAAFHDDLWFALGNQSQAEGKPKNVKEIMDTWTLQMNFPVVKVTKTGNRLRLHQSRYLMDPEAVDPGTYVSPFGYKWEIPFTFTTSISPVFNQTDADIRWLHKSGIDLEIELTTASAGSQWIIGNIKEYGYYRVNYEEDNWLALINQLNNSHEVIHAINRAQIINDAWNLAKSGDLKMEIALQTVNYLNKERAYIAWEAAATELSYVNSMLERTSLYGKFSKFMKAIVQDVYDELGLDNTGSTHLQSFLRSVIASRACGYGIQSCIDACKQLYREWMNGTGSKPIDASIRSTVYCTAIKHGGVEEWDFAFKKYKESNVASEKSRLMSALACSKETWILSRYLTLALTPDEIRKQDATSVIVYISRNSIGRSLTWDYVRARWDYIFNDYGTGFLSISRLISGITSSFNSDFEVTQLEDFIKSHPNLGSGTRAFQQAVEKTKSNMKWMENNYSILEKWLAAY